MDAGPGGEDLNRTHPAGGGIAAVRGGHVAPNLGGRAR